MNTIKLKKGLDILISGAADKKNVGEIISQEIGIVPDYYEGIVPKVAVKEGDEVQIGSPIFYDKSHPELKIVSPVCGKVKEVARGERRKLLYILIERNGSENQVEMPAIDFNSGREAIHAAILASGFGSLIRQRPYDVIANPTMMPKSIFVSAFDTAPLAPDYGYTLQGKEKELQAGLTALSKIAKVYYNVCKATPTSLQNMENVEVTAFEGAHPAGNAGVQINHLDPVNKGEIVWTMNVQDIVMMGNYILTGKLDMRKTIAVVGPKVSTPSYVTTITGSYISDIDEGKLIKDENIRVINGNPLTGIKAEEKSFLSPFAGQITVIAEGDHADELLGWAMPRFNKFSNTNLFFTKIQKMLCPKKQYEFDARICGGERAFIMSGEYDRVFPMDIMPEQLVKAMIAKNLDKMEQLGAYEVAPEDFALCEFVCTSKIETQRIVREALNYMRKELE